MKKTLVLTAMLALTMLVSAQKKVAVWETKCDDGSITKFQSTMVRGGMEAAVANAEGYTGYDRTAFDAILKEQNFQRSGAVSDADIKRMGEMAGVQYIIVPEAMAQGNDFYIIVKMLDVESGEYGAAYEELCTTSSTDIKNACSTLGSKLFGSTSVAVTKPVSSTTQATEEVSDLVYLTKTPSGASVYVSPYNEAGQYKYKAAEEACSCKGEGWRLPTLNELTIISTKMKDSFKPIDYLYPFWGQEGKSMFIQTGQVWPTMKAAKVNVRCVKEVKK